MVKKLIFTSNKSVVCMPAIAHPGVRNAGCKPVGKMANDCGGLLSLFMLQRSGILNLTQQSGTEDRRTIACLSLRHFSLGRETENNSLKTSLLPPKGSQ